MSKRNSSKGRTEQRRLKGELASVSAVRDRQAASAEIFRLRTIADTLDALESQDWQVDQKRAFAAQLDIPFLFVEIVENYAVNLDDVLELSRNRAAMEVLRSVADERAEAQHQKGA